LLETQLGAEQDQAIGRATEEADSGGEPEQAGEPERPKRSRLARSRPSSGTRIRRTIYWACGRPVSLVYIPALADEHPEATSDEPLPMEERRNHELATERRAPQHLKSGKSSASCPGS
jgi:hypothetical protein